MTTKTDLTLPLVGQQLKFVPNLGVPYDPDDPESTSSRDVKNTNDLGNANAISSQVAGTNFHRVVLDVDHPVKALPSTTEGHFHLFIDKKITWKQYKKIMKAFVEAGIVEPGYLGASKSRGFTAVRLPWVKKPVDKTAKGVVE